MQGDAPFPVVAGRPYQIDWSLPDPDTLKREGLQSR
jgi:hypothetical protein